jgi:hypothetical protein
VHSRGGGGIDRAWLLQPPAKRREAKAIEMHTVRYCAFRPAHDVLRGQQLLCQGENGPWDSHTIACQFFTPACPVRHAVLYHLPAPLLKARLLRGPEVALLGYCWLHRATGTATKLLRDLFLIAIGAVWMAYMQRSR